MYFLTYPILQRWKTHLCQLLIISVSYMFFKILNVRIDFRAGLVTGSVCELQVSQHAAESAESL